MFPQLAIGSCLILYSLSALAQGPPTSAAGRQFTCPAGPGAVQAFAGVCPLSLTDGSASLNSKLIVITYANAPASYEIQGQSNPQTYCRYGRTALAEGTTCNYYSSSQQRIEILDGPNTCPRLGSNDGRQPRPSGGGKFQSRQSPSAVQMVQPSFICPTVSTTGGIYLRNQFFSFQDASAGVPENRILCYYFNTANPNAFYPCAYQATTGAYLPLGDQVECPTTPCPSPQYMQSMRKRTIGERQVKADTIRARGRVRAVEEAVPDQRVARRRKV